MKSLIEMSKSRKVKECLYLHHTSKLNLRRMPDVFHCAVCLARSSPSKCLRVLFLFYIRLVTDVVFYVVSLLCLFIEDDELLDLQDNAMSCSVTHISTYNIISMQGHPD